MLDALGKRLEVLHGPFHEHTKRYDADGLVRGFHRYTEGTAWLASGRYNSFYLFFYHDPFGKQILAANVFLQAANSDHHILDREQSSSSSINSKVQVMRYQDVRYGKDCNQLGCPELTTHRDKVKDDSFSLTDGLKEENWNVVIPFDLAQPVTSLAAPTEATSDLLGVSPSEVVSPEQSIPLDSGEVRPPEKEETNQEQETKQNANTTPLTQFDLTKPLPRINELGNEEAAEVTAPDVTEEQEGSLPNLSSLPDLDNTTSKDPIELVPPSSALPDVITDLELSEVVTPSDTRVPSNTEDVLPPDSSNTPSLGASPSEGSLDVVPPSGIAGVAPPIDAEVTPIDAVVPPIGWEGEGEVTTTSNSIEDFNACGWDYLTNEDARKCLKKRNVEEEERRLLAELEKSLGDNQDEINELLWIDIVDASEGTNLNVDGLQLMLSELKGLGANPVIFNDFIRKLHIVVSQGGDFGEFSPAEFNLYLANVQRADFAQGPMFDAFKAMDASLDRSLKSMASINNVNDSMMQGLASLSYWESTLFGMDVPDAWGNTALGSFFLGQGLKQDGSVGSRLSALLLIDTILIAGAAGRVGFKAAARQAIHNCANSFSADTPVATASGLVAISSLSIGQDVYAYNEIEDKVDLYEITATHEHLDPVIIHLTITTNDQESVVLETTPEHPFYVEGLWVDAEDLTVGDKLSSFDGHEGIEVFGRVSSLESIEQDQLMYNLTVEVAHTFFVGDDSWLVHNTGPCNIIIDDSKFKYIFGNVSSNSHNFARSNQLALEMQRLGINDTPKGHAILKGHFELTTQTKGNIINTFSNQFGNFEVRDSFFIGPSGKAARFQTTFEILDDGERRLITTIPFNGGQ